MCLKIFLGVTVIVFQTEILLKEIGINISQSLSHGLWEHTVLIKCVWKRMFPLTTKDTQRRERTVD